MDAGRLYRPVSCLSFAINWFFGQESVVGYHIINICIHLTTSLLLYKTILLILRSPALENQFKRYEYFIAAFSTLLWAINPVQTQAVTYIAQRMTLLGSSFFYIIGIWGYLRGLFRAQPDLEDAVGIFYFPYQHSFIFIGSQLEEIALTFSIKHSYFYKYIVF